MIIGGVFIPLFNLVWLVGCMIGMIWSVRVQSWSSFGIFLGIGFIAGLAIYFRLLNV